MLDTVYLDDLRCDGSAHGRARLPARSTGRKRGFVAWTTMRPRLPRATMARSISSVSLRPDTKVAGEGGDGAPERWRCQATEAFKASEPLKTSNLWQYWREFTNGNFRPVRFFWLLVRGFVMEVVHRLGLLKPLPLRGPGGRPCRQAAEPPARRAVRVQTPG